MNDLIFKAANVIHRTVLSLSGGRLGGDVLNIPVLELTTTGAKSGQKRTAMPRVRGPRGAPGGPDSRRGGDVAEALVPRVTDTATAAGSGKCCVHDALGLPGRGADWHAD